MQQQGVPDGITNGVPVAVGTKRAPPEGDADKSRRDGGDRRAFLKRRTTTETSTTTTTTTDRQHSPRRGHQPLQTQQPQR